MLQFSPHFTLLLKLEFPFGRVLFASHRPLVQNRWGETSGCCCCCCGRTASHHSLAFFLLAFLPLLWMSEQAMICPIIELSFLSMKRIFSSCFFFYFLQPYHQHTHTRAYTQHRMLQKWLERYSRSCSCCLHVCVWMVHQKVLKAAPWAKQMRWDQNASKAAGVWVNAFRGNRLMDGFYCTFELPPRSLLRLLIGVNVAKQMKCTFL